MSWRVVENPPRGDLALLSLKGFQCILLSNSTMLGQTMQIVNLTRREAAQWLREAADDLEDTGATHEPTPRKEGPDGE